LSETPENAAESVEHVKHNKQGAPSSPARSPATETDDALTTSVKRRAIL
jgi:hypothetical protein